MKRGSGLIEQVQLLKDDQKLDIINLAQVLANGQHGSKQGQSEQCTACPERQLLGSVSFPSRN